MSKIYFNLLCLLSFFSATAQNWTPLVSGTNRNLHDISIVNNQTVYAISSAYYGDNDWAYSDILLRSFDNGNTWDTLETPGLFAKDVFFLNDSVGFISGGMPSCGIAPTVTKTTDRGLTWNGWATQSVWNVPMSVGMGYSAAYFWDADKGYVFGGNWGAKQYKTLDNGTNWLDLQDFTSTQSFPNIFFFNEMEGYVVSDSVEVVYDSLGNMITTPIVGYIHKTTDGGINWGKQTFANDYLTDVHFPSQNIGYVAAGNHLWKTTDAGTTWSSLSLPFISQEVAFSSNTLGYIVAKDGDIYKTIDGGINWGLDYAGDFLGIEIKNGQGFAVGKNGSIVRLRGASNSIATGENRASFEVFPNPTKDIIHIVSPQNDAFSVEIYNALGQMILTKEGTKAFDMNLSTLADDTYFLYIKDKNGKILQTTKVVK